MSHEIGEPSTIALLKRLHSGDHAAMERLLARNLEAVQAFIRRTMIPALKHKVETGDVVNDAVVAFLRHAPPFTLRSEEHFRRLLCHIARNRIKDRYDWFTAQRRDMAREQPLAPGTTLELDIADPANTAPDEAHGEHDRRAWFRMALELLDPLDRSVIVFREYEGLSFKDVGEKVDLDEDAVRKRFDRALPRLALAVRRLRNGELTDLLEEK